MKAMKYSLVLLSLLLLGLNTVEAQGGKGPHPTDGLVAIRGVVVDKATGKPVEAAAVNLVQYGLWSITCPKGTFTFNNVPLGKVDIVVQNLGYAPFQQTFEFNESKTFQLTISIEEMSFGLKEVAVVAKENKAGASTGSTLERTVIEHVQPNSLGDLMQLLPGQVAQNPDLSKAAQVSIRQVEATDNNAFGASVVVDGAPISNNANLQVQNTASSSDPNFTSVSGKGVDLRQISADNIESVEVIRGIPSVEYGDLTSGAVIVNTKAGKAPLEFRTKINPNNMEFSVGKGFELGEKRGFLNVDADYTRSYSDQRFSNKGFKRFNGQLSYSNSFLEGKMQATFKLSGYSTIDEVKKDPDDEAMHSDSWSKERGVRFTGTTRLSLNKPFSRSLKFDFSAAYGYSEGYYRDLISPDRLAITWAKKDTMVVATYLPGEYWGVATVEGEPINLFAKLTNSTSTEVFGGRHRIVAGLEVKSDGNVGAGFQYDVTRPAKKAGASTRPRSYNDIPFLNIYSAFLEDNLTYRVANRDLKVQAGLRYDLIQPGTDVESSVLAPRFNASYKVASFLEIRGGYGVTAKAPGLVHLYPNNAYFDLVSCDYYSSQNPAERLTLLTTRVISTENHNIRSSENSKVEMGADLSFGKVKLAITLFQEKLRHGFSFSQTVKPVTYDYWNTSDLVLQTGQPPLYDPSNPSVKDTVFMAIYTTPTNSVKEDNKGVEFDLNLGRIEAIRTSISANGAYIYSERSSSDNLVQTGKNQQNYTRLGIYPADAKLSRNKRFTTAIRIVHNIPELRFVASLTIQTIWLNYQKYSYAEYPIGYIDSKGEPTWLTPEQARLPEYSDLVSVVNPNASKAETWPNLWQFNLRLTKNITPNIGFSFFANNVFYSRPTVKSKRTGTYQTLNPDIFFGTELYMKF